MSDIDNEHYIVEPKAMELQNLSSDSDTNTSHLTSEDIRLPKDKALSTSRDVKNSLEKVFTSKTDPMGKFLKKNNLTINDVIDLNIENKILQCPKTQRTKYHKRKGLSDDEKLKLTRQRNREHARATRLRRKIYQEVNIILL